MYYHLTINIVSKVYFINKKRKNKKEKERNKWWIGDIPTLSVSLSPSLSIRYQGCIAPMIPTHPTMNKGKGQSPFSLIKISNLNCGSLSLATSNLLNVSRHIEVLIVELTVPASQANFACVFIDLF